ncbi:MAG: peptidoglycan DD-metalloendopeptidase family protein [Alphaproteobacteria bacterium]
MSQFDPATRFDSRLHALVRQAFPEREVVIRSDGRLRYLTLSTGRQVGLVGVALAVVLWSVFASSAYFIGEHALRQQERDLAGTAAAYRTLVEQVADHQERMEAIASTIDQGSGPGPGSGEIAGAMPIDAQVRRIEASLDDAEARRRVAEVRDELVGRLERLAERIRTDALPPARPAIPSAVAAASTAGQVGGANQVARTRDMLKESLRRQLDRFSREVASLSSRTDVLEAESHVGTGEVERRKLLLQRDIMARERDELNAQVDQLQAKVASIQGSHADMLRRFSDFAAGSVNEVEKALGSVGLDLKKLVDKAPARSDASTGSQGAQSGQGAQGAQGGQGGPFIPAGPLSKAEEVRLHSVLASLNVKMGRWDNLQQVVRKLPLGAPLRTYQLSSAFGVREDPINGNPARHEGIDLAAPSRTAVVAPSAGVVSFVGWKGRFGRTVIIDHGNGFQTLYGHLHKTLVTVGQKVDSGKQIGEIGSTGRSTGPHLHYEVRINGKPQDPYRFMKAGKNVLKG